MSNDLKKFLTLLSQNLAENERLILCGFHGDPNNVDKSAWRPRPWRPGMNFILPADWNVYICVSAFRRANDGTWRRRRECFGCGLTLMVDDVGTKVDPALVSHVEPTAIIETSPENYQHWYFLSEHERDCARFDALIRAFIAQKLSSDDPGMSGVTRVGRLPGFENGKKKYGGFRTVLREFSGRRFSVEDLILSFGLDLRGQQRFTSEQKLTSEDALLRNRQFELTYKTLRDLGMLKRDEPDISGWTEIKCPWVNEHTNQADNGAAIREPAPENDYHGAFRCHHGHCMNKGWGDLIEELNNVAIDVLAAVTNK